MKIETSPLKVKFGGLHFKFALDQPQPGQLRLLPNRGVRVLAWTFCVLGWPLFILGLLALLRLLSRPTSDQLIGVLILLGLGFPFSFGGVVLLGQRFRFDLRSGEMTIRRFWRTRRRPLTDIAAVQVLNGGLFGSEVEGGDKFVSYQLNLILADPSEPRLFVAYNWDQPDIQRKAKRLADFLKVPLLMNGNGSLDQ